MTIVVCIAGQRACTQVSRRWERSGGHRSLTTSPVQRPKGILYVNRALPLRPASSLVLWAGDWPIPPNAQVDRQHLGTFRTGRWQHTLDSDFPQTSLGSLSGESATWKTLERKLDLRRTRASIHSDGACEGSACACDLLSHGQMIAHSSPNCHSSRVRTGCASRALMPASWRAADTSGTSAREGCEQAARVCAMCVLRRA